MTIPTSPLVRSYLAFALDRKRQTTDANAQFHERLSTPDRVRKLLDWGFGTSEDRCAP